MLLSFVTQFSPGDLNGIGFIMIPRKILVSGVRRSRNSHDQNAPSQLTERACKQKIIHYKFRHRKC